MHNWEYILHFFWSCHRFFLKCQEKLHCMYFCSNWAHPCPPTGVMFYFFTYLGFPSSYPFIPPNLFFFFSFSSNPPHPNTSMHILHTFLGTFPVVLNLLKNEGLLYRVVSNHSYIQITLMLDSEVILSREIKWQLL